jgi:hypothetical protein
MECLTKVYGNRFYSVSQKDVKTEEDLGRYGMSMRSRNRLDCLQQEAKMTFYDFRAIKWVTSFCSNTNINWVKGIAVVCLQKLTNFMELSISREAASRSATLNFPTFYGTRRFITVFTKAFHLSLS